MEDNRQASPLTFSKVWFEKGKNNNLASRTDYTWCHSKLFQLSNEIRCRSDTQCCILNYVRCGCHYSCNGISIYNIWQCSHFLHCQCYPVIHWHISMYRSRWESQLTTDSAQLHTTICIWSSSKITSAFNEGAFYRKKMILHHFWYLRNFSE